MQLRGESGSDASKAQIAFFKAHDTVMDPTQSWNELSGRPAAIAARESPAGRVAAAAAARAHVREHVVGRGDPAGVPHAPVARR